MKIDIRRANTDDDALISELSSRTFLDTFSGTCTDEDITNFVADSFNIQRVHKELQDAYDYYFIAYFDNHAAGYLRLKEVKSEVPAIKKYKSIELKRIYVLKEYHTKKVGAALMKFALQFAAEKGYEAVWLGVWEYNEKAKLFYEKWGFTYTGSTHDFPIGNTPQTDQSLIKILDIN